jgi:hypothetical protein
MSGTKKRPLARTPAPRFSERAVMLFRELESTPSRRRNTSAFKDAERELARQLNLVSEFWSGCSVLDSSSDPCWPPGVYAYSVWFRMRAVREVLLEASLS